MVWNKIILYQDDNEITRVAVRFADEDLWLTQNQLAEIYQSSKSNVSKHIKHIIESADGKDYQVAHYNLDKIIALGYRVHSQVAVRFRRCAVQRLHEYIQKGFALDDDRFRQGDKEKN